MPFFCFRDFAFSRSLGSWFCRGLGLGSLPVAIASPRPFRSYRTAEGEMDIQASPLRSYVLFFVPLLSGGPGAVGSLRAGRAVDLRSTHVAVSVTGFGPFPCSSTCLSRQCSGPVRSHALLSERNEALLPIGDRGKAAPGAVAVPRGDRGPTSPTIRAAYPVPTRGHCKCPAGRLKLCLD